MLLPLAEAVTLGFTTPIFAVIFSALLLKEPIGPYRWTAVLLGLLRRAGDRPTRWHLPLFGSLVGLGAG